METLAKKPGHRDKQGRSLGLPSPASLAGAGVGLLALVLYLLTLAPTVLYYTDEMKDSAVLPAIAYTLGIGHPTGYPTYTMLTHLFTYLPVGDVAYRVNLASAVFGALAVAALFFAGLRLGRSVVAALVGAVAFGTSPLFWSQAIIAEIYTMHIFFLALALFVLLLWRDKRQDRYLLLTAGVIGLAMTHNLTSGLLLPTAALFVLLVEPRKVLDWRVVLGGAGIFLLSLLPYAYLPIRARMDPVMNVEDPSNWERFEDLVTGGEFKDKMWAFGPEELPARFEMYFDNLTGELPLVFLALALVGVVYTLLRDRAGFVLLALPFSGFLLYALEYDIEDIHYYFIPTYAILALWASTGLAAGLRAAGRFVSGRVPRYRAAAVVALSALALAVPVWGLPETYAAVDRSEDYEGRRIIETVVENAAPNAIVIQHRGPLHYMELVQGRRTDIEVWNFSQPNGRDEGIEAYNAIREGRFYILYPNEGKTRQFEEKGYELVPVGERETLFQVVPAEEA